MIPFKILAAAIATFVYIVGKLSSELKFDNEFHGSPYWRVVMAIVSGIAAYFWVSALFGMASNPPIGVFFGVLACILCIAYNVNKIEFPDVPTTTDKMSEQVNFVDKEGTIIDIIDGKPKVDGDISCVGELFENKETVIIHVCGDVKIGDRFRIVQNDGQKLYAITDLS